MLQQKIKTLSDKYFARVIELRRRLHAHPELSWHETETSKLVAEELMRCGIEVQTKVAKHGVVGILRGKKTDSRCLALRADMDALPIHEENKVDYCSRHEGIMHACGHDVHTANLLGAAMILSELKEEIEGSIKFIFQPSEEKIPSGAEAMIAEGVLQNPSVDKILGLHVSPELEAGTFGFCSGKFMASSDEIYLTVVGKGGHAARPDDIKNPLLMAAEILLELRMLSNPQVPVVLSFGKIEGKGATNVVPDKVEIAGTLRCFDEALRAQTHSRLSFFASALPKNIMRTAMCTYSAALRCSSTMPPLRLIPKHWPWIMPVPKIYWTCLPAWAVKTLPTTPTGCRLVFTGWAWATKRKALPRGCTPPPLM